MTIYRLVRAHNQIPDSFYPHLFGISVAEAQSYLLA